MTARRTLTLVAFILLFAFATPLRADAPAILGAVAPSAQEQAGVYAVNRARSNPTAYGNEIGVDLSSVAAQPPLAVNTNLTGSARWHALDMLQNDYFAHTSATTGYGPNQMAANNGYDLFGAGLNANWGTTNTIESIAYGLNRQPDFPTAVATLITDANTPSLGHRVHLLAMTASFQAHREIGCGRAESISGNKATRYYSIQTGYVNPTDEFITGVVYDDANGNGMYDAGEGLGGVAVKVDGTPAAITMSEGGYSIPITDGAHSVEVSGTPFEGTSEAEVNVSGNNVEVDFASGKARGEVDFAWQYGAAAAAPSMSAVASVTQGDATLVVDFAANSQDPTVAYAWDFGDGGTSSEQNPSHSYTTPGLYTVIVHGTNSGGGTATKLLVVSVGDPGSTGGGTAAPASHLLTAKKGILQAKFKKTGHDQILFTGLFELPAGFAPGAHPVQISIAGVKLSVTLDEKNKGLDANGNRVKLKYKKPKKGQTLAAGVIGKVLVKLKGDFRRTLMAAGMPNATQQGTLSSVPFAFYLDGVAYSGTAAFSYKAHEGRKTKAKLVK